MLRHEFQAMMSNFERAIACSEESGLRTPEHNRNVGGSSDSAHVHGLAQDLILDESVNPDSAIVYAKKLGFCGIEWDERNRHLHLDMHPNGRHWWVRIDTSGVTFPLSLSVEDV